MKILNDECLRAGLKETLAAKGHEGKTVRKAGFGSKKNGELLTLAEGQWDVLLANDRNIKYQQNMTGAECFRLDSPREIESHEGLAAAHASLF